MKTFLNVLYRRILYKIPLKLLLILLAVFGILFASFSNSDFVSISSYGSISLTNNNNYSVAGDSDSITCVYGIANPFCTNLRFKLDSESDWYFLSDISGGCAVYRPVCFTGLDTLQFKRYNYSSSIVVKYFKLPLNICPACPACPACPSQYTSLECQTEYDLIPINSVDSQYCVSNNLCPSNVLMTENQCKSIYGLISSDSCSICPVGSGGSISNVYINDILHLGAPNIIMNISDEIDWDYAYTASGYNMNIDVVGYNVDYEKVQSVIDLQNYKPTDEDFSEIISVLSPYSKIIIFFIVLFSLWAMIKKPFKSKKL